MKRRNVIAIGGLSAFGGTGAIVGNALYGSSSLGFERSGDSTVVRKDGERIESLSLPVTPVEDDNAVLGMSIPNRTTVQTVAVDIVWAIQRDGLWSDVIIELSVTGDVRTILDPGGATAYSSVWGSPSETKESFPSKRRYAYPLGTTAGRANTLLTVMETTHSEEDVVEVEVRLSARSLDGTRVELTAPTKLISNLD
ncbi:hypothetical protein [Natrinema salsiterrestre]|uniref:Uncharacterized protein n=1 Tax=Natrinema salsiterrestre TaxID=2950540 RepID=A0A9Q4Q092_9EURY|nr:hypothetical protein [Natrinema salsiterrestre]MDF9745574.1 hypothetical protein [Natrinema salsiterrestre]